ncbi:MAG: alpha/beta hydrolase [Myxacorys chilensis ATA2-1-KO14]|jgi:pimeloyl-ACP methyl ester carboxylesterase|nr:alpha/beta hydrolase [Myxacorys chilensis ATA2-1-KO14]
MPRTQIGNIGMYYEVHGSGEPVVLIHGLSMDSSTWFNQVSALSQKYQVIVFDNRGVGQTDAPHETYSTEMMANDVAALLKFLNVDNAHILGFSMGGMIAQTLTLKYPELVKSLLLTATAAQFPARAKHLVQIWLRMLNENVSLETSVRDSFLWVYTNEFFEHDETVTASVNLALNHPHPLSPQGFAGQVAALMQHDTRSGINQISVPTLVLIGRDEIFIPLEFSEELAAKIPKAELVILERGGHNCWMEFPEQFNQAVMQFLEGVTSM